MSKLQVGRLTNTDAARHTVVVKLPIADAQGVVRDEEIRVVYRGMSIREAAALDEKYDSVPAEQALPEVLAANIAALPDIVGEDDAPIEPSVEFFQTVDGFVLNRIRKAIDNDRLGNPTN
jgi:hypothetical protein